MSDTKHYPKVSWHLHPERVKISEDGEQYIVQSYEHPLNKPIPLPKLVNQILMQSEFTDQVKRFFTLKKQNQYAPSEHTKREQDNVEARIKELIKRMEAV